MYLTTRSAWLMAVGILLALEFPHPLTVVLWSGLVILLIFCDVFAAPAAHNFTACRQVADCVLLGQSTPTSVIITNHGRRRAHVQLRDAWPPSAGAENIYATLHIDSGKRRQHTSKLTPTRRGDRQAAALTVRVCGPLKLAGRQFSLTAPARLRVLPAFTAQRHLPNRLARLREMDGRSAVLVRGNGTEFDSLRQYIIGDDVRAIDWRSSMRRGEVVVRTWRPERDRKVFIVIDTGSLAAARLGNQPRLDAQIEAALLLSALAAKAGDRVEVITVAEQVGVHAGGQNSAELIHTLATQLATVSATLTETNWTLVRRMVEKFVPQRAFIVILTALESALDAYMAQTLNVLARKHVLALAGAEDPQLEYLLQQRHDAQEVYTAASAARDRLDLGVVRARLQHHGVEVVQASAADLAPQLADAYLKMKAAGRL